MSEEIAAEYVPVAHLKGWKDNPRDNDHAVKPLMESIKRFGFAAPVVARKADGMIIAGHTRVKAALELRMTEVPVRWMDLTEAEAHMLALADNKLSELSLWAPEKLASVIEQLLEEGHDVDGLGFSEAELEEIINDSEPAASDSGDIYTDKVQSPVYEITGEKPNINDLMDMRKSVELIQKIKDEDITEEERTFLLAAACRHTVFSYDLIAEYYAHAGPVVQELMEESALVIIDFDSAIERGFVTLTQDIAEAFEGDHG